MSFQHVHRPKSQNSQTLLNTSLLAPSPFATQDPKRFPIQEEIENQAFDQDKCEVAGLQLRQQYDQISSVEQERLGVLQAKMDRFWTQRSEQAEVQPDALKFFNRNATLTQAAKQPNNQSEKIDQVTEQEKEQEHKHFHTKRVSASTAGGTIVPPIVHEVLNSPGQPLDLATRDFMETHFRQDFSRVRVHTDEKAVSSAREVGSLAYTFGQHVVFGAGSYKPETSRGKMILSHELAHTLQQGQASINHEAPVHVASSSDAAEQEADNITGTLVMPVSGNMTAISKRHAPAIQRLTSEHGQNVITPQGAIMTSDLTSPVVENALVRYHVEYYGAAIFQGNISYHFELQDRQTGNILRLLNSTAPTIQLRLPGVGRFRILCHIRSNNSTVATVSLEQNTVPRDPAVASLWPSLSQDSAAQVELIEDFRTYVIEAAAATGAQGITPLFLASLLRIEIANTPLTPLGSPRSVREQEITGVENALQERGRGQTVAPRDLDRSIGVGQIRPSTAAMVMGSTPWVEQDPNNRGPARAQTEQNYQNLSVANQREIVTRLRWPRSNIRTAADLLVRLKNRPNRFPTMSRANFGTSQRAVEIIATEYNLGASNSPLAVAQPSWYGQQVWQNMQDALTQRFFPNT